MTTITDEQILAHFEATGRIAIIWSIEDVRSLRPDLTEAQGWAVLETAQDQLDAEQGLTWSVLEEHADTLFPLQTEQDAGRTA